MPNKKLKTIMEYVYIAAGCLTMAAALNIFLEPNGIVIGGATGIAIIVSHINIFGISIPLWLTNTVINIPLFLISFKVIGFQSSKRALFGSFFLSFSLLVTEWLPKLENDLVLASVFGGLLSGLGLGLVFRQNAATGGSDMTAVLLNRAFPRFSPPRIMFVIDAAIILAGLYVFGFNQALYALIAAYITAKFTDIAVAGLDFAKSVLIISDESELIAQKITRHLHRGATFISGNGVYSGNEKKIIMCVVSPKQLNTLISIVKTTDVRSFVIVSDTKEIYGEGFHSI